MSQPTQRPAADSHGDGKHPLHTGAFAISKLKRWTLMRTIVGAVAITWVVLFALTLYEGTALGGQVLVTFLRDHAPHGRFLIALPLLLWMRSLVPRQTQLAIDAFRQGGLVANDSERFELAVAALDNRKGQLIAGAIGILVSYGISVAILLSPHDTLSTWMFDATNATSWSIAGLWHLFVATPLLRTLLIINLYTLITWCLFIGRVSRMRLVLNPFHPDVRCGVQFVADAQLHMFAPLIAAMSIQLGCAVAVAVSYNSQLITTYQLAGAAFVVAVLLLTFGPLLMLWPPAYGARQRAKRMVGIWASHTTGRIAAELSEARQTLKHEPNASDIAAVKDAAGLLAPVIATRSVLADARTVQAVLLAAVLPMLLPLATLLPVKDIAKQLLDIIL